MKRFLIASFVTATLVSGASAAIAAPYTFVGAWTVDTGPSWLTQPTAYTGQEAAAFRFGGAPGDYVISTLGSLIEDINFQAWYSILGVPGGFQLAQDLDQSLPGGLYYDGNAYTFDLMSNPASAFVNDNALGVEFTNYAFRVSEVPLPATGFLLLGALGGVAILRRRSTSA